VIDQCIRNRACSRSQRTRGPAARSAAQVTLRQHGQHARVDLVVLHANGASPFTFCASAINTSQPNRSSLSCTNRAPSSTRSRHAPARRARAPGAQRPATPSPSLGVANSATSSPCSDIKQTSIRLRLRSNPACNMKSGLLELALDRHLERVTEEASFIAVQPRSARLVGLSSRIRLPEEGCPRLPMSVPAVPQPQRREGSRPILVTLLHEMRRATRGEASRRSASRGQGRLRSSATAPRARAATPKVLRPTGENPPRRPRAAACGAAKRQSARSSATTRGACHRRRSASGRHQRRRDLAAARAGRCRRDRRLPRDPARGAWRAPARTTCVRRTLAARAR